MPLFLVLDFFQLKQDQLIPCQNTCIIISSSLHGASQPSLLILTNNSNPWISKPVFLNFNEGLKLVWNMTKLRYLLRNTNVYSCLMNWSFKLQSEMEFLYGIFIRGFWVYTRVFSDSSFNLVFYLIFPFYKMLFMKTRVSWFSIIIFLLHKMLFMNRLEFSCFADFL